MQRHEMSSAFRSRREVLGGPISETS